MILQLFKTDKIGLWLPQAFLVSSFLTLAQPSLAFSVSDHRFVSEMAINNLVRCQILPTEFLKEKKKLVIAGNLEQDSAGYLLSKWFRYSRFYNPILPIRSVGPMVLRAHSADAVSHYKDRLIERIQKGDAKEKAYEDLGAIMHHLQDASGPLHVMAINHGVSDGFEAKLNVQSSIKIQDLGCPTVGPNPPLEPRYLHKLTGLNTLARIDEEFGYLEDGNAKRAKWNEAFFVNQTLSRPELMDVLNTFKSALDKEGFLFLGLPDSLKGKLLSSGRYGAFNGTERRALGLNNFSKEHFEVPIVGELEGKRHIEVPMQEYVKVKRDLLLQSIESSQKLLIWMSSMDH